MSSLPEGWVQKSSKSHPGKPYYFNSATGETSWTMPTAPAFAVHGNVGGEVQVRHILRKHAGSRRPASWRSENIIQSKDEAVREVLDMKSNLEAKLRSDGYDAMHKLFQNYALEHSDCGSHERGGDLGMFGRGQMQKSFEDASFGLQVGQMSDLVDSDSGIHIILRIY
jgi:NIMA-interacting peptidyl-prolyl cis-trans isomerase 1